MKDHDILGQEDYFINPKPEDKKDDKEKPTDIVPPREPDEPQPEAPEKTEDQFDIPDEDQDDFEFPGLNEIEETESPPPAGQKKPEEESGDFLNNMNDSFQLDEYQAEEEVAEEEYEEPEYKEPDYEEEEHVYDSYEDEKQEKVGYKPIIIGGILIILLIAVFFGVWQFILKDAPPAEIADTPPAQTQQPETAGPAQAQEQQRRTQYFSMLAGKTSQDLSFLSRLVGTMNNNNRLSSILLYGDVLYFEVFGNSRDGLAKLNLKLKENFKYDKFSIVSSEQRPGTHGGVFGLYFINLKNRTGNDAQVNNPLSSGNEADVWLQSIVKQNNVHIKDIKHRSPSSSDQFQVYKIETNIAGPLQDCLSLLKGIAAAGKNIEIHKLTFNAADQRKFNQSNYLLTMILNVYV